MGMIAFAAVFPILGCSDREPLSGFSVPVRLAIASTPLSARITPTKETQGVPSSVKGFEIVEGKMWNAERDDSNNDNQRRQSQGHCEIPAMARAEKIDGADRENHCNGGDHDVILRDAQIAQSRPTTESPP
jgi:hypothetical protein